MSSCLLSMYDKALPILEIKISPTGAYSFLLKVELIEKQMAELLPQKCIYSP